ncbi:TPA: hypothetical protein PGG10_001182 [Acinetobacter nosocomialis]|uniref:hypothetical protein n=1 Tax=Acinetobacter calcoaceticus/baumannii complex TaxID=909768 RepID=UPI0012986360|nr:MULTISPECIES: hypothetical protein [Acinetobacter calcoaceticus/baumannii complex]MBH8377585.1 hypothetical protein [Acinetobacter baumannii]MBJ8495930.1 hypothetical protein [Acinetobacter nosocomialis]MRA12823.1 hypothetical protein [Acinetobacter nosocomialis]NKN75653.1 hypothetical protein [Acinetobacter baumannii]HDG9822207.1 hypothetical protein [Acinetobacter nosocomialis]
MKPEQFIREYGVEKAREVVEGAPDGHKGYNGVINQYTRGVWFSRDVMLSDLKRLVESVDLVNSLGGIKAARSEAHKDCFVYNQPLLAAIAAYESIYGGGDE